LENNKVYEAFEILRGSFNSSNYVEVLSGLFFIKAVCNKYDVSFDCTKMTFTGLDLIDVNQNEKVILNNLKVLSIRFIEEETFQNLISVFNNMSNSELADLLLISNSKLDNNITPLSLSKLALELLELNDNDSVLDLCSGYGLFLTEANKYNVTCSLHGREINTVSFIISQIVLYLKGIDSEIKRKDVLIEKENDSFDKVFSNFPFLMKLDRHKFDLINKTTNQKFKYDYDLRVSSDWIFVSRIINSMKKDGKGIAIMADGPLYKSQDADFRKELINSGYVEAIIQLPERLLFNTQISITMLVLSRDRNRSQVKVIDASQIYSKGRRMNELTEENIETILNMYRSDEHFINLKEIENNNYLLSPRRYSNQITIDNPIKVGDFALDIFRGVQITAKELDQGVVDDHTYDYQVLNLSDINENKIDYSGLQKVKLDGDKWDKYLLQDKDLVLSAKGSTFKTSIVEINEDEKIIASGNLMVVRINQEKINPYYVKVFLDSPLGRKVINSVQTGSVLISIGKKMLEDMEIPYIALEKQNVIASKYLAYVDELDYYFKKQNKLQNQIDNLFEDEMGGE
jgi:type I restriction enzyme M protein